MEFGASYPTQQKGIHTMSCKATAVEHTVQTTAEHLVK